MTNSEKQSKGDLYALIPDYVRNNPNISEVPEDSHTPGTTLFIPTFVQSSIAPRHNPEQSYNVKVKGKILRLDNPPKEADEKKARKNKKYKPKYMTAKERRELKIHDLPKECHKYSLFQPLHTLWLQYMDELYGEKGNPIMMTQKLAKADYHGAIITVVKSRCHSYIGITGIMVQETENTFRIITQDDRLKSIPKAHSIFSFQFKDHLYTLYGNHICLRSSARSAKKFKTKPTIDL